MMMVMPSSPTIITDAARPAHILRKAGCWEFECNDQWRNPAGLQQRALGSADILLAIIHGHISSCLVQPLPSASLIRPLTSSLFVADLPRPQLQGMHKTTRGLYGSAQSGILSNSVSPSGRRSGRLVRWSREGGPSILCRHTRPFGHGSSLAWQELLTYRLRTGRRSDVVIRLQSGQGVHVEAILISRAPLPSPKSAIRIDGILLNC